MNLLFFRTFVCLIYIMVSLPTFGQYLFQNKYSFADNTFIASAIEMPNGKIMTCGTIYNNPGLVLNNCVMLTDTFGNISNLNYYSFPDSSFMANPKMCLNVDETISIIGNAYANSYYNIGHMKFDSAGQVISINLFNKPLHDFAEGICSTNDSGNVIYGSTGSTGLMPSKGLIIKLDNQGNIVWSRKYGLNGKTYITDLHEKPNGNLLFIATTTDYSDTIDFYLGDIVIVETDSMGVPILTKRTIAAENEQSFKIIPKTNGNYYLSFTSEAFGTPRRELAHAELDSNFNVVWTKRIVVNLNNFVYYYYDYIKTFNDEILMLHTSRIIKFDSAGNLLWKNRILGESFNKIIELNDQNLLLVGYKDYSAQQSSNGWVVKLTKDGISGCVDDTSHLLLINPETLNFVDTTLFSEIDTFSTTSGYLSYPTSQVVIPECSVYLNLLQQPDESQSSSFIYPNPSSGTFTLKTGGKLIDNSTIVITDILGKVVWTRDFIKPEFNIDITNEPNGVYLINLISTSSISNSKLILAK